MKKLLIVALLSLGLSASAEDLLEIYNLALSYDPSFASAVIQRQIGGENMKQSLSSLLPQINFGLAGGTRSTNKFKRTYPDAYLDDPLSQFTGTTAENNELWITNEPRVDFPSGWSVNLNQVLFSIPTFISYRNSRLNFEGAKESFASAERSLIIRVVEAYFAVLQARDSLENSLARRESIERQLQQTEQRYEVGLTAITDVLNARATFDNQEVDLNAARNTLDTAFLTLKRLTGQPIQQLARLTDDYPIENPDPNNEDYWVDYALRNNPQVLSAERSYSIARWNHWSTLASWLPIPTINFSTRYSYSESAIINPFNEIDTGFDRIDESIGTTYSLNIGFAIPGGRAFSQNKVSALGREQSRLQMINQRLTVEEQTRTQFRNVVQIVLQLEALERSLESSRASLEATEKGYEVGTRNIIEVLNAQNSLFSTELNYQNTIHRYITSMLRLKETVGLLKPDDLYALNEFMDRENVVTPVNSLSGK